MLRPFGPRISRMERASADRSSPWRTLSAVVACPVSGRSVHVPLAPRVDECLSLDYTDLIPVVAPVNSTSSLSRLLGRRLRGDPGTVRRERRVPRHRFVLRPCFGADKRERRAKLLGCRPGTGPLRRRVWPFSFINSQYTRVVTGNSSE